jgi:cytochrome P450
MADGAITSGIPAVPDHIPGELVVSFDFYSHPDFKTTPYEIIQRQRQSAPRIYYSPTHYLLPGCWVVSTADDIRHVLQHPEVFSSREQVGFSKLIGEAWALIPLELDPPDHAFFRSLLNPLFSPKEIAKLEVGIQQAALLLIEQIRDRQEFEFVESFAHPFPVSVFLQLLGFPLEEMETFIGWNEGLLRSFTMEARISAMRSIVSYLRKAIAERTANPGNDLISIATQAEINGRKVTDDEIIGICFLLFVAGLDTVASSLGFYFKHLAEDQPLQAKLRADRSLIPNAIEEFLRLYGVVSGHRRVVVDTELNGVFMKKGDWVTVPTMNANRDPNEFPNPDVFDLDRSSNRHVTFAFGPHRCIGSHLARREFVVALNAWFDHLPPFSIKPGTTPVATGGAVFGITELQLVWNA